MITSLALKIGAFSSVGAGGLLAVVAISNPQLLTYGRGTQGSTPNSNTMKQIVLKVLAPSSTSTDPTNLTSGSTDRNYVCKSVRTKNNVSKHLAQDESCDLVKLTIDSKNWIDLTGVKKTKTTNTLSLTDARLKTNYFRLDTSNDLFFSTNLSDPNISIEVFKKGAPSTVLAKFSHLFKLDNGQPTFHKTTQAIGRANTAVTTVDSSSKCTLDKEATSAAQSCVLTAFGSAVGSITGAGYSNQTFSYTAPTTQTSPLTANQYYLINFNTDANDLIQTRLNTTHINFVKTATGTPSSTSQTLLSDVSPVILVGEDSAKKAFILSETPVFSVVVEKKTAPSDTKELTVSGAIKNYQCRMSTTIENCTLVPIVFDTTKHLLDVKAIKDLSGTPAITIQSADTPKTYYKLEVSNALFSKLTGKLSTHTIDIVEAPAAGQTATAIASFTPFITIDDSDSIIYDKSTYIVHAATLLAGTESTKTGAFDKTKIHWCSFSTTGTPDSSAKKCTLSEFSTTGPFAATTEFSQSLTETASPIDQTKLYLIKYTEESDGIDKINPLTNQIFYFEEGENPQSKNKIASFSDITPVILVDTESSKPSAFVLK